MWRPASPVAVVAVTFVGARADTEIAVGIGAEISVVSIQTFWLAVTPGAMSLAIAARREAASFTGTTLFES
jgi:hypothetical protein